MSCRTAGAQYYWGFGLAINILSRWDKFIMEIAAKKIGSGNKESSTEYGRSGRIKSIQQFSNKSLEL
jgi:hypothetical protein